jgi:uncharacterized protein with FMN-binding domain
LRRAVLTVGGTVAGLAALFSFKTHSPVSAAAISTPTAGAPTSSASGTTPTGPAYPTASSLAPPASTPTAGSSSAASKTPTAGSSSASMPASTAPASTPSSARTTAPASSAPATKAPTKAPTTPAAPATSAPAGKSGSFTGATSSTQYGPVDVTVTMTNGKITAASGSLEGQGDSIGQNALPVLNGEAVSAQSASIAAVSGASYTSQGYIQSLQSALDQAGL